MAQGDSAKNRPYRDYESLVEPHKGKLERLIPDDFGLYVVARSLSTNPPGRAEANELLALARAKKVSLDFEFLRTTPFAEHLAPATFVPPQRKERRLPVAPPRGRHAEMSRSPLFVRRNSYVSDQVVADWLIAWERAAEVIPLISGPTIRLRLLPVAPFRGARAFALRRRPGSITFNISAAAGVNGIYRRENNGESRLIDSYPNKLTVEQPTFPFDSVWTGRPIENVAVDEYMPHFMHSTGYGNLLHERGHYEHEDAIELIPEFQERLFDAISRGIGVKSVRGRFDWTTWELRHNLGYRLAVAEQLGTYAAKVGTNWDRPDEQWPEAWEEIRQLAEMMPHKVIPIVEETAELREELAAVPDERRLELLYSRVAKYRGDGMRQLREHRVDLYAVARAQSRRPPDRAEWAYIRSLAAQQDVELDFAFLRTTATAERLSKTIPLTVSSAPRRRSVEVSDRSDENLLRTFSRPVAAVRTRVSTATEGSVDARQAFLSAAEREAHPGASKLLRLVADDEQLRSITANGAERDPSRLWLPLARTFVASLETDLLDGVLDPSDEEGFTRRWESVLRPRLLNAREGMTQFVTSRWAHHDQWNHANYFAEGLHAFANNLRGKPFAIIHLGAESGLATRALQAHFPQATFVAVESDRLNGSDELHRRWILSHRPLDLASMQAMHGALSFAATHPLSYVEGSGVEGVKAAREHLQEVDGIDLTKVPLVLLHSTHATHLNNRDEVAVEKWSRPFFRINLVDLDRMPDIGDSELVRTLRDGGANRAAVAQRLNP